MSITPMLARAALAACLLAACAGSARATEELAFRPSGTITATSSGAVSFVTSAATVACSMTLTGSLRSGYIPATEGSQLGEATAVRWASCSGGELRSALGLPWRLNYGAALGEFEGSVSGFLFTIANAGLQFSIFFGLVNCLYGGAVGLLTATRADAELEEAWDFRSLRALEAVQLPLRSGPEACPREGSIHGSFTLGAEIQARRRVARMHAIIETMAPGQVQARLTVHNISPAGEPNLEVQEVKVMGGANPELFEVPAATNNCKGANVAPGAAPCESKVNYNGLENQRPKEATVKIRRNNGVGVKEIPIPVMAE